VVVIEFLDDSIRDPQEITTRWGLPIHGIIATYPTQDGDQPVTLQHPRSPISEAFRTIRTNLQFASIDHPLNTILVTSCSPGEGKTSVAVNLAIVAAQTSLSAVLVDADLRKPRVHRVLKLTNRLGLTDLFIRSQDENRSSIRQSTGIAGLSYITSGNLPPNPSELLSSEKMLDILNQLKSQFKSVFLDSPPLLVVPDALALAARVDGVLLVVRPATTKWSTLSSGVEKLKQVNANLLGVVINDVKIKRTSVYYRSYYSSEYYGKNYDYQEGEKKEEKRAEKRIEKPVDRRADRQPDKPA